MNGTARHWQRALAMGALLVSASAGAVQFTQVAGGPESPSLQRVISANGGVYAIVSDRIFKTIDGAATWSPLPALPGKAGSLAAGGGVLFITTSAGVFRSGDDGATWTPFDGADAAALPRIGPQLFATGTHVFAAGFERQGTGNVGVLFRSAIGNPAWQRVTPANSGGNGIGEITRAGNNLCLLLGNSGVRFSTDNGLTWLSASGVNGDQRSIVTLPGGNVVVMSSSGQLRLSTNSCQTFTNVNATGLTGQGLVTTAFGASSATSWFVGTSEGAVLRSTDSGGSFTPDNSGDLPAGSGLTVTAFTGSGAGLLAATSGRGVLRRVNNVWTRSNAGLEGAAVSEIIDGAGAGALLVSLAGGVLHTADGGATFSERNSGLTRLTGGDIARLGDTVLRAALPLNGTGQPPGLFRSTDGGLGWTQVPAGAGLPDAASINEIIAGDNVFLASKSFGGLYRSTDGGQTWAPSEAGLPANPSVRNLAVQPDGTLYAYVANQGVYRSDDDGVTWTQKSNGLAGSRLGKIFATGTVLIASASQLVHWSEDRGETWTAATGFALSRFGIELLSLAQDANGALYLGDEHAGLSVSTDNGRTWTPDSTGLARSAVCIERIHGLIVKNGKVYAGQGEGGGVRVTNPLTPATRGDDIACTTDTDIFPNSFSFADANNVAPSTLVTSATGIFGLGNGVTVPVSVTGGEYSIGSCDGPFTSAAGTIGNGTVCVRHTSAAASETATVTTLTVGDVSGTFTSRTGLVFTGRPDQINTSFGAGGFGTTTQGTRASDMIVLPDGSVVLAGSVFSFGTFKNKVVLGVLDATGAQQNLVQLDIGGAGANDTLAAVLRQSTGKLVLAGWSQTDNGTPQNGTDDSTRVFLARLDANLQLDPTFGTGGIVLFDANPPTNTQRHEIVGDAVLGANDTIFAVGGLLTNASGVRYFAVKFSADGVVDTSYGDDNANFADGVANIQVGSGPSVQALGALMQPDGKLVIVGQAQPSFTSIAGVIARLNADGTPDTGFGQAGSGTVSFTNANFSNAVLGAANRIVVAGAGPGNRPLVLSLTSAGAPDTTFSGDGQLTLDTVSGNFRDIALLANGRYAVVGTGQRDGSSDPAAVLYAVIPANGALDGQFGTGGFVLRGPVNGASLDAEALQQRSDGGVVVGGSFNSRMGAFVFGGTTQAPADTTPDAFDFQDQAGVATSALVVSNSVTIAGTDAPAPISVAGGEYSIGTGGFTAVAGSIAPGAAVRVRHTSSANAGGTVTTTLTIGGVSATFTTTTAVADTTPDPFMFVDRVDVPRDAVVVSAPVTITGIAAPAPVSITGGQYSVGCTGVFTNQASTIADAQSVCVRHTSSSQFATPVNTVLTIGTVSDTFTSTTQGQDTTPAAFLFQDRHDVEPGSVITSNTVVISGMNDAAAISVQGGSYSIGCDATFVTAPGTIAPGQGVCVRHTAAAGFSSTVNTTLTIGGVSDVFSSTTRANVPADTTPDAFSFTPVNGVEPETLVISNSVTVAGISAPAAIAVQGGSYSVDGAAFTSQGGTVTAGRQVRVRVTSGPVGENRTATLTIGGVSAAFSVTTRSATGGTNTGTLPDANGEAVTVTASIGQLENLRLVAPTGDLPDEFDYPFGFFAFDIAGLSTTNPQTVRVTLTLAADARPEAYVKCTPTGCARFDNARITRNLVTLTLVDNGPGDSDPTLGRIADPGAPVTKVKPARNDSGGGLPALTLVLLAAGLGARRRVSRPAPGR